MPDQPLDPRKTPRQARSASTVEVILQAATRVLMEESLAGFNTNRVAEVAGVSVGSLYQYFPNKAAMVVALIERSQASLADAVEHCVTQSRGKSLHEALLQLTEVAIHYQFGNPVFAAALDHEERRLPVEQVINRAQERLIDSIAVLLSEHNVDSSLVTLETTAADCFEIVKSLVESEGRRPAPNLDALRERVVKVLQGYLLQPQPANVPD